jgi:hypothetical protein
MQCSLERYYETSKSFLVLLLSSKSPFCFLYGYYRKMHEWKHCRNESLTKRHFYNDNFDNLVSGLLGGGNNNNQDPTQQQQQKKEGSGLGDMLGL